MGRLTKISSVLLLVLAFASSQANAQSVEDTEVTARLRYPTQALYGGQTSAKVWWWSWVSINAALAGGQLALGLAADDDTDRNIQLVGAGTSVLATVDVLLNPWEPARLPSRLRPEPEDTPDARAKKMVLAEQYLERAAARERKGRSLLTHMIPLVIGGAGSLVMWLAWDRPEDAAIFMGSTVVMSELQIWTQPTRAMDALSTYRTLYPQPFAGSDGTRPVARATSSPRWRFSPFPGGVVAGCQF